MYEAEPAGGPQPWVLGRRRIIMATGMLVYPAMTAAGVAQYSHGARAIAGYVIVAGFCCCYLLAVGTGIARRWTPFAVLLAAMVVLFIAVIPFARADGFLMGAVVFSFLALVLRRRVIPLVAVGVLASLVVPWAVRPWHSGPGWYSAVAIIFTVLMIYGFSEIANANRALVQARAEIAQLASDAERTRIARDLHDLLGHSLTAITVKAGLASRLAATDSARSFREIAEVEGLSRQVLADMRAAVSNYRDVTLAGELARGRELLRASGIMADLPTATDVVDSAHQELLAWAVREGLTNVVRHAHATRCTVLLSAAEMEIRDDGVGGPCTEGNGLSGLRERVAAVGGSVEAGPCNSRGWRLRVALGPTAATST